MTAEPAPHLLGAQGPVPGGYLPVGDEVDLMLAAWEARVPVLLKGPTGCGKTRLVESVAARLGLPLTTVSCHEDLSATDLMGRYLLEGGDTLWADGPLTRSVREGGLCYLDEIVEARTDATVVIHSLLDHRRNLYVERRAELLAAPDSFMLVVSYNPGYQNLLKDLKPSTRQRFAAIELGFPPPALETRIVQAESGTDAATAEALVRLGQAVRQLSEPGLSEVASSRTLIAAARLAARGIPLRRAAHTCLAAVLTDDPVLTGALSELVDTYLD